MGLLDSILGIGTNPTTGQQVGQDFSQQDKDFIKAQFKYGLLLNQKLAAGQITQAYHDANFWLTTETLQAPYNGWFDEFAAAINSEDLAWLSKQVGESVEALTTYMGSALTAVSKAAAAAVGTALSSTSTGLVEGFFGSLNIVGWAVIGGIGFAVYWGWKKGYLKRALGHELNKLIP